MELVILGFGALFLLLFWGLPIAFSMMLVGAAGLYAVLGWRGATAQIGQIALDTTTNYTFAVLALFILMGNLLRHSKMAEELYAAADSFLGHRRGGLAMSTVVACGGFSAVCGSSLATAATVAPVSMPPMRQRGYADSLAAGSIAAGGTLGILIPPSVVLVLYGSMTETDIGALFIAALIPGLLGLALYVAAVWVAVRIDPSLGPAGPRTPWPARLRSLAGLWKTAGIFLVVMGGIYLGVFSPTEAAGIGAAAAFVLALALRVITFRQLVDILADSAATAAALMFLVVGAVVFSAFVNLGGLSSAISGFIGGLDVGPMTVMLVLVAMYIVLGCVLEAYSMILLTVPIVYPIVAGLGFDLVWFGILLVVVVEISLITPPIGMNVFVLRAVVPDVRTGAIFRGLVPFIAADFVRVALLLAVPGLALFLPDLML